MEGPDHEDLAITVLTCKGDLKDPTFPFVLNQLVNKLKRLVSDGKRPFLVTKVEPWNSVRVTFNISKEAAQRLRLLAERRDNSLRDLGVLSVQVEGDQVITLTIANNFNQSQELLVGKRDEESSNDLSASTSSSSLSSSVKISQSAPSSLICNNASSSAGSSSVTTLSPPSGGSLSVEVTRRNIAQYLSQQSSVINLDTENSTFKSPNVIAPKNEEPLPFLSSNSTPFSSNLSSPSSSPSSSSSSSPSISSISANNIRSNLNNVKLVNRGKNLAAKSRPSQSDAALFPFASMQHAMHTKQGASNSMGTIQQSLTLNTNQPTSSRLPIVTAQSSNPGLPVKPISSPSPSPVTISPQVQPNLSSTPSPPINTNSNNNTNNNNNNNASLNVSSASPPSPFIRNPSSLFTNVRVGSSSNGAPTIPPYAGPNNQPKAQAPAMALVPGTVSRNGSSNSISSATSCASSNVALTSPLLVNLLQSDGTGSHPRMMPPPPPPSLTQSSKGKPSLSEMLPKKGKQRKSRKVKDKPPDDETFLPMSQQPSKLPVSGFSLLDNNNPPSNIDSIISPSTPPTAPPLSPLTCATSSSSPSLSPPSTASSTMPIASSDQSLDTLPSNNIARFQPKPLVAPIKSSFSSDSSSEAHSNFVQASGGTMPRYLVVHSESQEQPPVQKSITPPSQPSIPSPQPVQRLNNIIGSPSTATPITPSSPVSTFFSPLTSNLNFENTTPSNEDITMTNDDDEKEDSGVTQPLREQLQDPQVPSSSRSDTQSNGNRPMTTLPEALNQQQQLSLSISSLVEETALSSKANETESLQAQNQLQLNKLTAEGPSTLSPSQQEEPFKMKHLVNPTTGLLEPSCSDEEEGGIAIREPILLSGREIQPVDSTERENTLEVIEEPKSNANQAIDECMSESLQQASPSPSQITPEKASPSKPVPFQTKIIETKRLKIEDETLSQSIPELSQTGKEDAVRETDEIMEDIVANQGEAPNPVGNDQPSSSPVKMMPPPPPPKAISSHPGSLLNGALTNRTRNRKAKKLVETPSDQSAIKSILPTTIINTLTHVATTSTSVSSSELISHSDKMDSSLLPSTEQKETEHRIPLATNTSISSQETTCQSSLSRVNSNNNIPEGAIQRYHEVKSELMDTDDIPEESSRQVNPPSQISQLTNIVNSFSYPSSPKISITVAPVQASMPVSNEPILSQTPEKDLREQANIKQDELVQEANVPTEPLSEFDLEPMKVVSESRGNESTEPSIVQQEEEKRVLMEEEPTTEVVSEPDQSLPEATQLSSYNIPTSPEATIPTEIETTQTPNKEQSSATESCSKAKSDSSGDPSSSETSGTTSLNNLPTDRTEPMCSDEEEDRTTPTSSNNFQESESTSVLEAGAHSERSSADATSKDNYHSSDTDSGIGKFVNDASSQSSSEVSNSARTPPSEIVPCLNDINNNSQDQTPVEVELLNLELVDVDLTIRCEGDSIFDVEELSLPKVMSDLNYPIQGVIIDSETMDDDMGHSVASGDHNYTSVKSPCLNNGQDLDFTVEEADIEEESESNDKKFIENTLPNVHSLTTSSSTHHSFNPSNLTTTAIGETGEVESSPDQCDDNSSANITNNILSNCEDNGRIMLFSNVNQGELSSSHPSSCPLSSSRPRENPVEASREMECEILGKSVKTTTTTTTTTKLRRRKMNDESNSMADTSISICDRQLTVNEISVKSWKKTRLRPSKSDTASEEGDPVKTTTISRAKRINCKDNKREATPTLRVSERKRKVREPSGMVPGQRSTRRSKEHNNVQTDNLFVMGDNQETTIDIIHDSSEEIRKSISNIYQQVSTSSTSEAGDSSSALTMLNKRKTRGLINTNLIHL